MLIRVKRKSDCQFSEVTDERWFRQRRRFLKGSAGLLAYGALGSPAVANTGAESGRKIPDVLTSEYSVDEPLTSFEDVTTYNNFYEFSTDKKAVAALAKGFQTRPWVVNISGEIEKPVTLDMDDLMKRYPLEERVYRFRCVEAWSMVIPWVGFPLAKLIRDMAPTSKAKYVEFTTLHDPEKMPGQRRRVLPWPYVEGLRIDEAMNPLTLLAVGVYGEMMPPQNGAPLRLVVPWKYAFKSIKSIVAIRFTEQQPANTWQISAPREYGFYANVNPNVDHPRWSQARERRIGDFFKRETLMFNGYGEEVAGLYKGLDLKKYY